MEPNIRFSGEYYVIQSDGVAIESHQTQASADRAVETLTQHEARCAERRAAGDVDAIRADRPGRPFGYRVERRAAPGRGRG